MEGQRVIIGTRAGPKNQLYNVLHELAHFIEIDENRCNKPGWGLKYGKWVDNPFPRPYSPAGWHEYSTDQHIRREIRVWAYQANLHQHFGLKVDFEDLAEAALYLPDFFLYVKGIRSDKQRVLKVAAEIEFLAAQVQYSFPEIIKELERKRLKLRLTSVK